MQNFPCIKLASYFISIFEDCYLPMIIFLCFRQIRKVKFRPKLFSFLDSLVAQCLKHFPPNVPIYDFA